MKAPKPPTPPPEPDAPSGDPEGEAADVLPVDPSKYWQKSYLRIAANSWDLQSIGDAKQFALECVCRAEALASVLAQGVSHDYPETSDIRQCLELMADLLNIAPLLDWWDDEDELMSHGWTPPQETAVQR